MDRDTRNLQHNKPERETFSKTIPSSDSMRNGEKRYALVSGILRLYVKQNGELWYFTGTRA